MVARRFVYRRRPMSWGGRTRGIGAGATALAVLALALPGGAAGGVPAGTDTIVAPGRSYTGGTGTAGAFRLTAGQNPVFRNDDLASEKHNVIAVEDGPDDEPLFQTPLIAGGGTSVLVAGTEYLQPGTYDFICTIHTEMTGKLEVAGVNPKPRPSVSVAVASKRLGAVKRSGQVKVRLSAATDAAGIGVAARIGGKGAGRAKDVELEAGGSQVLKLKLGAAARKVVAKAVKKGTRIPVAVSAEVPWGAPAAATAKLR